MPEPGTASCLAAEVIGVRERRERRSATLTFQVVEGLKQEIEGLASSSAAKDWRNGMRFARLRNET
jgi:hypothetical protein